MSEAESLVASPQYKSKMDEAGTLLTVDMPYVQAGWSQKFLAIGCAHIDNPHCRRDMLKDHLDEAKHQKAGIAFHGDTLDVMQGPGDRRASKNALSDRTKTDSYFNAVVDDVYDFLEPYKAYILYMSLGNHETAVIKHYGIDLLDILCKRLGCHYMGYAGFVRFKFEKPGGGGRSSKLLFFNHGAGGGGEVTKGTLNAQRQAARLGHVDIVMGAHYHERWYMNLVKYRVLDSGRVDLFTQHTFRSSAYKDEHADLRRGYQVENDRPPKPLGGWWWEFKYNDRERGNVGFNFSLAN